MHWCLIGIRPVCSHYGQTKVGKYMACVTYVLMACEDFNPRPVLAFSYCNFLSLWVCLCIRVCVLINHLVIRTTTHKPVHARIINWDQRCKTPFLRSSLFWGRSTLHFKVKIVWEFQKITPSWACPHHISLPVDVRISKLGPEFLRTLVYVPIVLWIDLHVNFETCFLPNVSALFLFSIYWDCPCKY